MIIILIVLVLSVIGLAKLRADSEYTVRKYMEVKMKGQIVDKETTGLLQNLRVKWHRYDAAERIIFLFIFAILLGNSIYQVLLIWFFLLVVYGVAFDGFWNKNDKRDFLYLGNDAEMDTFIKRVASWLGIKYRLLNGILRGVALLCFGYLLINNMNGSFLQDLTDWAWMKQW